MMVAVLLLSATASAETTFAIDGITYTVSSVGNSCAVTDYDNSFGTDVRIPASVNYRNRDFYVTEIGERAFSACELTSIDIPETVTLIEYAAFEECSLTSITIPGSVIAIEYKAFHNCRILSSVSLSEGLVSIGEWAFNGCGQLSSIMIPKSVTSIGSAAFTGCLNLAEVHISDLYDWCNISFHDWGSNPLENAHNLYLNGKLITELIIPNDVKTIKKRVFSGCTSLTSITIPESVTSIGEYALYYCSGLTSITIPNSTTNIDNYAFNGCSSLKDLYIEDGEDLLSLGYNKYDYYYTDGKGLFYDCPLETLYLGRDLSYKADYRYGQSPFSKISTLKSVIVGNCVTQIGNYAFNGCSSLVDLRFEDGEKITLGYNTKDAGNSKGLFYDCPLEKIYLGRDVEYDHNYNISIAPFRNQQKLKTLIIGSGVTSIIYCTFYGCNGIDTVINYQKTPLAIYENLFEEDVYNFAILQVPKGCKERYQETVGWKSFWFVQEFEVPDSLDTPSTPTPEPDVQKCATPVVNYGDCGLDILCDTEGAEILSTITCSDVNSYNSSRIDFSATYSITAYATKPGCEDSESVTATLCWIAVSGNSGEDGIIEVKAMPVLITCMDGTISIRGGQEGTEVLVFSVNGVSIGNATITNGNATINTTLAKGEIAVVSIAGRSFKVVIQ